ncbi:type II toxin-antitoxin system RelB/DinJ family antitoxin [Pectinatus haikarae]|uniref:DNA-damage-inducible protein J n=1 Tax=Pectinatus haikarae TaxID=349096 RepID=A0ABT9Y4V4_9FIRM|nr:type II toxin-antitoxin system RelB/DinJ family antitoxin [Pectinatus haikarae]MDQ0202863.1 DNA-damage-inducible protein J [Pectinatus haikarae]
MPATIKKKAVTMTIRVDADLKNQAEILCDEMGLTMSAAYNVFLKALVRERAIPFKISAGDSFYSEKNMQHLKDSISRLDNREGKAHELLGEDDG